MLAMSSAHPPVVQDALLNPRTGGGAAPAIALQRDRHAVRVKLQA